MTRADFRAELQARGFDGFDPAILNRLINFGEWHIARFARFTWMERETTVNMVPGDYRVMIDPNLDNLKALRRVVITTAGEERELEPINDSTFFSEYAELDLTSAQVRAASGLYYLAGDAVYILPPPQTNVSVEFHYWGGTDGMQLDADTPITPTDLDEAILLAAEYRCHSRARNIEMAREVRRQLDEIFADELAVATMRDDEFQERVEADSWLAE